MKKLMMIAAMMVATVSASAQEVEVGQFYLKPMVGATMTTLTKIDDKKMKVGLLGGAEVGVKVAEPFDVTAGLLFMMQGTKAKDNEVLKDYSVTLTYLNVPIMANVYVLPGLALKAGVQPGFLLTSKAKASQNINGSWQKREDTSKDGLNKVDFSIPMGISYEFSNFIIDARYNLGLTKVIKDGIGSKNSVIMLTVGYKIPF